MAPSSRRIGIYRCIESDRSIDGCQCIWHTDGMSSPVETPQAPSATPDCTPAVTDGELGVEEAQRLARMFKALGDPTRVRLLSLIAARPEREACICDLTDPVGLAQPTVSHHMRQLVDAGLVVREQRGRWAFYRVVDDTLAALSRSLHSCD